MGRETTVKEAFTAPLEVTGAVLLSVWLGAGFGELGAVDSDSFGRGVSSTTRAALPPIEEPTWTLPSSREKERTANRTRAVATTKVTQKRVFFNTPPKFWINKKPT
jgi:hypothetical protein